jgi:hypothetical protein
MKFLHKSFLFLAVISFVLNFSLYSQESVLSPLYGLDSSSLGNMLNSISKNQGEKLRSEISFLYADIKYDGKKLKILEFGESKNAGFSVYDIVFKSGLVWEKFWIFLSTFNLSVWYVGQNPIGQVGSHDGISLDKKLGWDTFLAVGGKLQESLASLELSTDFLEADKKKKVFNECDLSTYSGIVVFKYRDNRDQERLRELEAFKQSHPNFLVLDDASRPYTANKGLLGTLFVGSGLEKFRPQSAVCSKEYLPSLTGKIMDDFKCDYFIVKPVNARSSKGVLMVPRNKLRFIIERVLNKQKTRLAVLNNKFDDVSAIDYWDDDENSEFIIEEYCPSKSITAIEKKYDPTMRVVFVLFYDKGKLDMNILESWWTIPPYSLSSKGSSLNQKHITATQSLYSPYYDKKLVPQLSKWVRLDHDDSSNVETILNNLLPKLYLKMLKVRKVIRDYVFV